jgi:ribosomal protein S27AE
MKNIIIEALENKNVTKPCPRCGDEGEFEVLDGFAHIELQKDPKEIGDNTEVGRAKTTAIITICNNCGFIALHQTRKVAPNLAI